MRQQYWTRYPGIPIRKPFKQIDEFVAFLMSRVSNLLDIKEAWTKAYEEQEEDERIYMATRTGTTEEEKKAIMADLAKEREAKAFLAAREKARTEAEQKRVEELSDFFSPHSSSTGT